MIKVGENLNGLGISCLFLQDGIFILGLGGFGVFPKMTMMFGHTSTTWGGCG